jgi:hypothetical protein
MRHLRSQARRTVALATVLVCLALTPTSTAGAVSTRGTAGGIEAVTSGTWTATAATTTMTFTSNTDQTSTITNTGTIALSAIGYKVTISNPSSGSPTFKVFACAVAWVSNNCSGGAGTQSGGSLAKNSTTTVSSTVVPPLSGHAYLQIEPATVGSSVTVTLATQIVSPTQLRAASKTNQ